MAIKDARTVVLITGANRGLGLALVKRYLLRPSHDVVAGVRRLDQSAALEAIKHHTSSKLIIVHLNSLDHTTIPSAIATLTSQGYDSIDLVIANAGISKVHPLAKDVRLEDLREHLEVNTVAPLALFQGTLPLLKMAATKGKTPKFVGMSSSAASLSGMDLRPVPNSVYGPTKAALNYLVRKIHFENEDVVSFVVDPGWVKTDMGNEAAVEFGFQEAETEIEDSVTGIVRVIDDAQKKTHSGGFHSFDGGDYPW